MFEKILVPLDGSQTAESILPYVTHLAKGLQTPVVVLVVAPPIMSLLRGQERMG